MVSSQNKEPSRGAYDPYWVFKEAAAFEREFRLKVEIPMLKAMAERVDEMWDEAVAKAAKARVTSQKG